MSRRSLNWCGRRRFDWCVLLKLVLRLVHLVLVLVTGTVQMIPHDSVWWI